NFGFAKIEGTAKTDMSLEIPKGTLGYMAPEQLLGDAITTRTDIYLGALLVRELLLGAPAFIRGDEPYVDYLQAMAQPRLAPIESFCKGVPRVVLGALRNALEPDSAKRGLAAVDMQRVLNAHRNEGRAVLKDVLARIGLLRADAGDSDMADDSSVTAPSALRL